MGNRDKKERRKIKKISLKIKNKSKTRRRKHLFENEEEDNENVLSKIAEPEFNSKDKSQSKETVIDKPSRRANFAFAAHPFMDEIYLFGGEFFNGRKTVVYNDLICYNPFKNMWTQIVTPKMPPPRCGHQMISVAEENGQLWLFGGEFSKPNGNSFLHYRDLWLFHLGKKQWEKIAAHGGPSARSGHRMVLVKNQIIVFGGYFDTVKQFKYFNDVYAFNLNTYKWCKIEPSGKQPAPRSGCQMVALDDGKILICGGYSKQKLKKHVCKGIIHTDMFLLTPEVNDTTGLKWKWVSVKQEGKTPSPRSACSIVAAPGNKAYTFGGVIDEESEENICGTFCNDLNVLDLENRTWKPVNLSGNKDSNHIKIRNKITDVEMKSVIDGVFTLKVSPSNSDEGIDSIKIRNEKRNLFSPSPRMNCGLVVKNGILYLYGGLIEDGNKQFTLADMYSLDLHKLDEWNIILKDEEACSEWILSESESESSDSEEEMKNRNENKMDIE